MTGFKTQGYSRNKTSVRAFELGVERVREKKGLIARKKQFS